MANFNHAALLETLTVQVRSLPLSLSHAQLDALVTYLGLLSKWNAVYNLTAIRDPEQMLIQHILDSLAAIPALSEAKQVLDVGSGGGLPGMVLAIWAREARPEMRITMVDTVSKKTAFLTQAKVELGLSNVSVVTGRVEEMTKVRFFDCITSRAFAELVDFVNWSGHLLAPNGVFLAMKGVFPDKEIARLPAEWSVLNVVPMTVPGMIAERHMVTIQRTNA